MGLLIPSFPSQTHVAMWRVGAALRSLGTTVHFLSTRRPAAAEQCHPDLVEESRRTRYLGYPGFVRVASVLAASPAGVGRSARYIAGLSESSTLGRIRAIALLAAAVELRHFARCERLTHVLVHSCADAAHIAAMSRLLGGPSYSLRLGGDLEVYGRDHRSKMRHAAFVVPAAEVNRQQVLREVGLPADRVHATWLGVDTTRFTPVTARAGTDRIRLVTVSRLHRAKGHIHALRAIRVASDQGARLEYTIAGSGPEEAALRRAVQDLELEGRVRFTGALGEAEVVRVLRDSDVFVLPSVGRGEAAPVALIEGMSCGLPAIASRIGGTAEMLADGVEGSLVEKGDEAQLAAEFVRFAMDADLRRRMGFAARRRAVREFDCQAVAQRILGWIHRHCGAEVKA